MNLPRTMRYKQENVLLSGIIPGPSEPNHNINTFLHPFVKELLDFWDGVNMSVNTASGIITCKIKCALMCVTCDTPAGRKTCGYLGNNAAYGCCKCMKNFPGSVGSVNYSGFDRSFWVLRTRSQHKTSIVEIYKQSNKTNKLNAESRLGYRETILLKLPYFDPSKILVIDPMHNLF